MRYSFGSDGVGVRANQVGDFPYSDGDAVESEILRIVERAKDRSSLSEELHATVHDWPSEYHLSRQRHVLVRPLEIQAGDRVLELGAGCGAITRYLGECGAHVDAVEGSHRRARVAAARTRDLDNVRVFCDDLMLFESDTKYDWVLLIGVLEYSGMFIRSEDPWGSCLAQSAAHLGPDGRLVVAIENRLGLKYLNGASEDHLGVPQVGIEARYSSGQPRTFSRAELLARASAVGLTNHTLLLPFPDYKLPTTIVDSSAVNGELCVANMLHRTRSNDYSPGRIAAFNDILVRDSIADSSLLSELTDSFLLVATPTHSQSWHPAALAWHYSLGLRSSRFACETRLLRQCEPGATPVAVKELLDRSSPPGSVVGQEIEHHVGASALSPGESLSLRFTRALARSDSATVQSVVEQAANEYVQSVREIAASLEPSLDIESDEGMAGELLDCIPRNILIETAAGGRAEFIDREWRSTAPIPLSRLLFRAALDLQDAAAIVFPDRRMDAAILSAFIEYGLEEVSLAELRRDEERFQSAVNVQPLLHQGGYSASISVREAVDSARAQTERMTQHRDALYLELRALLDERDVLKRELNEARERPLESRDRLEALIAESEALRSERDWWFAQFSRLRARRSVKVVLRIADSLGSVLR